MATADYSLRFDEKNTLLKTPCWAFSENFCKLSLFQKKSPCYSVINIDKNSKEVQLEVENKPKNKFLITVSKIIAIFSSIIFLGIPLLFEYIVFKIAKNKCDKFRKTYNVDKAILSVKRNATFSKNEIDITKKVTDIEKNLSFNTLNLMYLMLNHINNKDLSNVNVLRNSSVLIDFLVKNVNTFKNLKELQKSDVEVTLDSISILSTFLPNLEMIDFSNATYLDFSNDKGLDLTKFKNLKTLKLNFKKEFPKLTSSNFKLDCVKGLTIDLTDNDQKITNYFELIFTYIKKNIFQNCENVTVLINPISGAQNSKISADALNKHYNPKDKTNVIFKIVEKNKIKVFN